MRLTLLGTGSAMPVGDRYQAGYLVEEDDRALLVDCGSGVIHRLAATEPGYGGIETVLLTHHHLDHVADLLPLLKARWLAGSSQLDIFGPPGTRSLVHDLLDVHDYLREKVDVRVRDIDVDVPDVGGWAIAAMETKHSMQCFAYRLTGPKGDLTLSGDTEATEELARFADGSAVLVHDCSFPDDIDVSNHPTPSQLGDVLADVDIDRVILSHLYPHTTGRHEEMLDAIERRYGGRVDILDDFDTVEI